MYLINAFNYELFCLVLMHRSAHLLVEEQICLALRVIIVQKVLKVYGFN